MENERVILAIGRIERALSRIENAQESAPPPTPVDEGLEQRHEALKRKCRKPSARLMA